MVRQSVENIGRSQSITFKLLAQDGLTYFEPAFDDELAIIMRWGFEHMQGEEKNEGGSVYLRLSTRTLEQPQREMSPRLAQEIIDGAYWMRGPGASACAVRRQRRSWRRVCSENIIARSDCWR